MMMPWHDRLCWDAAEASLQRLIPFALCRMPGSGVLRFFSAEPGAIGLPAMEPTAYFEIGEWLQAYSGRVSIPEIDLSKITAWDGRMLSEKDDETENTQRANSWVENVAITEEKYIEAVGKIIDRCKRRGGKTVYSRVINGRNPSLDICECARELFDVFPEAFGFLYYTPATGCWLGATPETLLDIDFRAKKVTTMSFAGTRANAGDAPWDDKNIQENGFVADYICEKFRQLGLHPEVTGPYTYDYGDIQHLKRDISAYFDNQEVTVDELVDAINPTPALCGTPTDEAVKDIMEFELHRRGCYGGFVAINEPGRLLRSFVNLRSCHIETATPHRFEVYAGGGIIAGSIPSEEWEESRAKGARLLGLLSRGQDRSNG